MIMKKYIFFNILFFLLMLGARAQAQTTGVFDVRAYLPEATGWDCKLSRVDVDANGQPINFDDNIPPVFEFGVLEEMDDINGNPLGVYNRLFYYICDVQLLFGTGRPDVQIKYIEGNNPNAGPPVQNSSHGLGWKGFLTVSRVDQNDFEDPNDDMETVIVQKRLNTISPAGYNIPSTNFWIATGGGFEYHFPRIAIGLAMGDETFLPKPEPFTNLDSYGLFQGILFVTVTDVD